jgi:multiple sugar transport system substrate-binding protein
MREYSKWILCLVLVFSVFLSGCGNKSASGENGKITLNLSLWDENFKDVVDKSVAEFEKEHKNVKVKVTFTPWADYWTKTRTSLAGGGGPDVFWINGNNFYQYAAKGYIKDLQPFIDKDKFDTSVYTPSLLKLYSYKGDLYGMPHFLDAIALFYNKKMFDDAGIPYPDDTWTWDNVEKVGAQLTDKTKGIYGYVAQVKPQESYLNLIFQARGYVLSDDKKKSGFDTPEALSAFEWIKKLMDKGISPSMQQQMETEPKQIFNTGKAAMIPLISVNVPESYKMLGDKLGLAPLPAEKQKATVVHGLSWVVNKNTKEAQLSYELAKTLTNKAANENLAKSGLSIPAYQAADKEWTTSIPGLDLSVFIDSLKFGVPYPVSKNSQAWQDVMNKELQEAFLGKKSIEEATKNISNEMNTILANE